MNSLKVNEMVYKFQDLVEQKKVKTFTKFQNEIYLNFIIFDKNHKSYKFVSYELKKMHAFLKEIQHHPNSHLLAQALKPLFRMLVNSLIIPKIVLVEVEGRLSDLFVKYTDLISASSGRRIVQKTCDFFVIPCNGIWKKRKRYLNIARKSEFEWLTKFIGGRINELVSKNNSILSNEMEQMCAEAENGVIDTYCLKFLALSKKVYKEYLESE